MNRCLLFFLAALGLQWSALAHESPRHSQSDTAKHHTARGIVYHDQNANRQRDRNERGIAGIRVSNGAEIVLTDDQGRYKIEVDDDEIIFVVKPRGWMTPVNDDNLPQFFYIHKPNGSPANSKFAGVAPTGPLPESIDFPLTQREEPDTFKAILFGDPQPRNIKEVEYIAHDVIEQIITEEAHDAAFGVTLGDIVFDDLSIMKPLNQAIALIGIPWYNVIGNHDLNLDAEVDEHSDETFERVYGPAYYSFDHGPAHFLVLDNVAWVGAHDGQKAGYHGGLGERQMEFVRNDLAYIPEDQLVVLLMHIPLTKVEDRQGLYRLIEQRPATVSIAAHQHYMEHRFIGEEDGWKGKEKHHHVVNVTVSGSWWRGKKDERGIPHATMVDGGPNGYSVMEFDGAEYSLKLHPAGRPAEYQMNVYAPEVVEASELAKTMVMANVFAGSKRTKVAMRIDRQGDWRTMDQINVVDPAYMAEMKRDHKLADRDWPDLAKEHSTPHMWKTTLPSGLSVGTHLIEIRATDMWDRVHMGERILRVAGSTQPDVEVAAP